MIFLPAIALTALLIGGFLTWALATRNTPNTGGAAALALAALILLAIVIFLAVVWTITLAWWLIWG